MFETAQWPQGSEAAASLAQMAARSSTGSPELAALVRERQDLVREWQGKDKLLIAAKSDSPARRSAAAETALSGRLTAIDGRLAEIDARLARDFPDYAALASPQPVPVADVQASLRDDEALVLFLDTADGFKPLPEENLRLGRDQGSGALAAIAAGHRGTEARGCGAALRARCHGLGWRGGAALRRSPAAAARKGHPRRGSRCPSTPPARTRSMPRCWAGRATSSRASICSWCRRAR